jgi:hypothetical protein
LKPPNEPASLRLHEAAAIRRLFTETALAQHPQARQAFTSVSYIGWPGEVWGYLDLSRIAPRALDWSSGEQTLLAWARFIAGHPAPGDYDRLRQVDRIPDPDRRALIDALAGWLVVPR